MDKTFIDKYNLNEDVKRFKELNEYKSPRQSLKEFTLVTRPVMNEEGENQQDQNMNNNIPNQDPQQAVGQTNMSQPSNNNMEQSPTNNDFQQPQDDMQQMPVDNGDMQGGEDMTPNDMDVAPEGDFENEPDVETTEMEPDDEVIDVDDLTQSQQATEYKLDGVDDRIAKLYDVVQQFAGIVNSTNSKIDALKTEFEKRNPTDSEKINIRSQVGTPFTQSPKAYWDNEVKANPHYDVIYNNEIDPNKEQEEFEIKKSDVDNFNLKSISDTLNYNPKLEDYINF